MMFKMQHPGDLVSRLFMLEYMRDLGAELLYSKATPEQKKNMFYKFTNEQDEVQVDLNWEAIIFECTLLHLEGLLKNFLTEIELIDEKRTEELKKLAAAKVEENLSKPIDINLMSLAKARMNETNNTDKLTGWQQ